MGKVVEKAFGKSLMENETASGELSTQASLLARLS